MKRFARWGWMGLGLATLSLSLVLAGCSRGVPSDGKQKVVMVTALDSAPITEVPKAIPISLAAPGVKKAAEPKPADYATKFGSIKGRLVWGGDSIPEPRVLVQQGDGSVKDPNVCAVHNLIAKNVVVNKANKGFAYAYAYINKPNGTNPYRVSEVAGQTPTVTLDQKNCEYVPYATAIMQGQFLNLKSSDPVNHNVRVVESDKNKFNFMLAPNGSSNVPMLADRAPSELKCDIHPWMSGWFFVLEHPFFAVTDENGAFEIKDIPAGKQRLILRTGRDGFVGEGKGTGKEIEVKAGQTVDIGEIRLDPASIKG